MTFRDITERKKAEEMLVLSLLDHVRRGYRPKNSLIVAREADGWRRQPIDSPLALAP